MPVPLKPRDDYSAAALRKLGPLHLTVGDRRPLYIEKIYQSADIVVGNGFPSGYYLGVQANNLPGWTVWSQLFNQFKIEHAEVIVTPTATCPVLSSAVLGTTNVFTGNIHSSISPYNISPPSSAAAVMNDDAYVMSRQVDTLRRSFKPFLLADINDSLVAADTTTFNRWMSCADAGNASFGGIRLFFDAQTSPPHALANGFVFHVYVRMTIGFREPVE